MTTTVEITASCNEKTEIGILITDRDKTEKHILQDGESSSHVVYDERVISVRELAKETGE